MFGVVLSYCQFEGGEENPALHCTEAFGKDVWKATVPFRDGCVYNRVYYRMSQCTMEQEI